MENSMNAWAYLFAGIVVEVIGTMSLKLSVAFYNLCFAVLSLACFGVALFCSLRITAMKFSRFERGMWPVCLNKRMGGL